MGCSLTSHPRGYKISCWDAFLTMGTLFTGAAYAGRHFDLLKSCPPESRFSHKVWGGCECVPVLGFLVLLIERIWSDKELCSTFTCGSCALLRRRRVTAFQRMEELSESDPPQENGVGLELVEKEFSETSIPINNLQEIFERQDKTRGYIRRRLPEQAAELRTLPHCSTWVPRSEPLEKAIQRMEKNAFKAILEHFHQSPVYAIPADLQSSIEHEKKEFSEAPLNFKFSKMTDKGGRLTNLDTSFYSKDDQSILAGVFDGHGEGADVANYVNQAFQGRFRKVLVDCEGNVHRAFEQLIHQIHEEVAKNKDWGRMGTTVLVCYIDIKLRRIYTATVGDSEANIYRKVNGKAKSIPLSCLRNWGCKKEALRVAIALNRPEILEEWTKTKQPKYLRYPPMGGLNLSRLIGDSSLLFMSEHPPIIHKPKITMRTFLPGDIITLASDGVKDYSTEEELVKWIFAEEASDNYALEMVSRVISKGGKDNATVVAIQVSIVTPDSGEL